MESTRTHEALVTVQKALENWKKTISETIDFGSGDTEPRWVATDTVRDIIAGRLPAIPNTASGWQLYCSMEGSESAAEQLHTAMQNLLEAINNVKLMHHNELVDLVSNYFDLERQDMSSTTSSTKKPAAKKVNKAAAIREMLEKNPSTTFAEAEAYFKAKGLSLTGAQFYTIRNNQKSGGTTKKTTKSVKTTTGKAKVLKGRTVGSTRKRRKVVTKTPVVAAAAKKSTTDTSSRDRRVLQAQKVMQNAFSECWNLVQDEDTMSCLIENSSW